MTSSEWLWRGRAGDTAQGQCVHLKAEIQKTALNIHKEVCLLPQNAGQRANPNHHFTAFLYDPGQIKWPPVSLVTMNTPQQEANDVAVTGIFSVFQRGKKCQMASLKTPYTHFLFLHMHHQPHNYHNEHSEEWP